MNRGLVPHHKDAGVGWLNFVLAASPAPLPGKPLIDRRFFRDNEYTQPINKREGEMNRKGSRVIRFGIIFLVITSLLWFMDSSGLIGPGWQALPELPAPLLRAVQVDSSGFYGYTIIVETAEQYYQCDIFGKESCTWEPIERVFTDDMYSVPFTATGA